MSSETPIDSPAWSLIRGVDSTILQDNAGKNILDLLWAAAEQHPERGIRIYDRRAENCDTKTYPEFLESVRRSASSLQQLGVQRGDRILVALPTSWDMLGVWLGCVYLGAYPAAIAPPLGGLGSSTNFHEKMERFREVIGASRIVGNENLVKLLREGGSESMAALALSPDDLPEPRLDALPSAHNAGQEDLAFLQFTSGSTGIPRAVEINHRCLIHNVYAIDAIAGPPYATWSREWCDTCVLWLPLNHDMGLITCLYALVSGLDLLFLQPTVFLTRPHKWFELASGRNVFSPAPNFGYQFVVERAKDELLEGLDLGNKHRFCIGSEMVRPDTMSAFIKKMAGTGLVDQHLAPCYGMAETTVALSMDSRGIGIETSTPDPDPGHQSTEPVVNCGTPIPDTEIRVVDQDTQSEVLPEGKLGSIQARSPSVFCGYYNNPDATDAVFKDGWLITGDLGFIREGQLYIVGRTKEILIIRGENIMPHDIEWQVEEVRGRGGAERSGAFSIIRGDAGEEPVLVVETSITDPEEIQELEEQIRSRIGRVMSLVLADLAFVRRGQLPKTTSGKIKRGQLKEDYLQGRIERLN